MKIGKKGYGFLCTTRQDRLLKGIPNKYFYHGKIKVYDRTKVARYLQPVVASKVFKAIDNSKKYEIVLVSFQQTHYAIFH